MKNPITVITSLTMHPFRTFRKLSLINPATTGLFIVLFMILSVLASLWATHHDVYSSNPTAFTMLLPAHILVILSVLVLFSAIWHFTADLMGGAGRGLTLQYFVFIATAPLLLTGPLAFLFNVALDFKGVYSIVLGGLSCWTLILIAIAMKELYRFSFIKALLNLFIGPLILVVVSYCLISIFPVAIISPW